MHDYLKECTTSWNQMPSFTRASYTLLASYVSIVSGHTCPISQHHDQSSTASEPWKDKTFDIGDFLRNLQSLRTTWNMPNRVLDNYILNKTAIVPVVIQSNDKFVYDIVIVYDLVSV
jgi:hypothetical protein